MPVVKLFDADAVRSWAQLAVERLVEYEAEINALNFFPVADHDTGSNMRSTLQAAAAAVSVVNPSCGAGTVLAEMADGAMASARGNSGLILSQLLLGMATVASSTDAGTLAPGVMLARCLSGAERAAAAAVVAPVRGTMLSVLAAAAAAASAAANVAENVVAPDAKANPLASAGSTAAAAVHAARQSVADTPDQLAAAGHPRLVDAGAQGLLVVLEALAEVLGSAAPRRSATPSQVPDPQLHADAPAATSQPWFEVQFVVRCDSAGAASLRETLAQLGDCLVMGGTSKPEPSATPTELSVHVHTVDVGSCLEAAIAAGPLRGIRVDLIQAAPRTVLVAIATSPGISALFATAGARVIEPSGPEITESELLAAATESAARRVIVLPNSVGAGLVAKGAAVAASAGPSMAAITVLPTKSPLQGLAAVAVHDPGRADSDDLIAMAEAAAGTRFAEVVVAAADAVTYAGRCQRGDVLGLIDGEVVEIGSDYGRVATALVRRLIAVGGEMVTVLTGSHPGSATAAAAVAGYIRLRHPLVQVVVLLGGQTDAPLLIGVE